jgi:hypothetical protein
MESLANRAGSDNRSYQVFKNFRVTEDGDAGGFAAYGNVKGYLDSHGTIMWHGCYLKGIPALLKKGFVPDTHGAASWYTPTHKELIGFFTDVREDSVGLYVECQFHDTEFGQTVRTQLLERQAAGKDSGMSIGFMINDYVRILPQDYATEIPKYSAPEHLEHNLARAAQFSYVDICTEIEVYEVSLTVVPSNEISLVTEVRSGKGGQPTIHARSKDFPKFSRSVSDLLARVGSMDAATRHALSVNLKDSLPILQEITSMAEKVRAGKGLSKEDLAKCESAKEQLDDLTRVHRDLEKHNTRAAELAKDLADHHEDAAKYHRDAKKLAKTLAQHLDSLAKQEPPEKGDEEKPEKDADEEKEARATIARLKAKFNI